MLLLTLLEAEEGIHLPVPPWAYGLISFAILIGLLAITLIIGKGRPHS